MIRTGLIVVASFVFAGSLRGQDSKAEPANADPTITRDIRASAEQFQRAFDSGDASALAKLWTESGEYIAEDGERTRGRDKIETKYAVFFKANPGLKLTLSIDSVRALNADTVIEEGVAAIVAPSVPPSRSRYTVIHVKENGQWLMASVRDEPVSAVHLHGPLGDLDWLIGDWVAENKGVRLDAKFQWIANKSFIEQTTTVHKGDRLLSGGKQIIGWDAASGQIVSWTFTSDGGHAMGRWSPGSTGWLIDSAGLMRDGTPTTAVNAMSKLDENALVWRSVNRTVGPARVLDSDEVILKRNPPKQPLALIVAPPAQRAKAQPASKPKADKKK